MAPSLQISVFFAHLTVSFFHKCIPLEKNQKRLITKEYLI